MEWPRIPLPGWPDGNAPDAAEILAASAARGRELAQLLDPETPVPGVTQGKLRPEIAALAVPATIDGHNMTGDDFTLTAGWGHFGQGSTVMPGRGRVVERPYTPEERTALDNALPTLGETTFDIYLNDRAYWRNVPAPVWNYKLGGYQVLKKMAVLPGTGCARAGFVAGGGWVFCGDGEEDWGDNIEQFLYVMPKRQRWQIRNGCGGEDFAHSISKPECNGLSVCKLASVEVDFG